MKTFRQFLEEAAWRSLGAPQQAKELGSEFGKKDGEINYQLQADKEQKFLHPAIRKAMQNIQKRPDAVKGQLQAPREKYSRGTLRQRGVKNTTATDGDWDKVKKDLDSSKVTRAEKGRRGVQTSPTILRVRDPLSGKPIEHNVSGNTRLSSMRRFGTADVHVIKGRVSSTPKKKKK
jgi:hypothetical protein